MIVNPLTEKSKGVWFALLAGLRYPGSGVGLGAFSLLRAVRRDAPTREAALTKADAPWFAGASLSGGVWLHLTEHHEHAHRHGH